MGKAMSNRYPVKLDEIGTFMPVLTLRKGKEQEEIGKTGKHRNAQNMLREV
ncbi:hypothetical protein HCG69_08400 [Bacteroides sp. K03]|uniref:hypothetical protein n=1 Tax=Bacteroides sp. K03 TaxID=2718928 RepID=UPI001C8B4B6A|nr:hypothetical protein [Bacteroides sp. K03]MBX9188098.1 hypothetical protein [Bacteroides sp. K03]